MSDDPYITPALAQRLIAAQFPQWAGLDLKPVATSGWDNRSFHLGSDKIIRMPSAARYAPQPEKERAWLPHLARHLTPALPQVLGEGQPGEDYPFCWNVLSFVPGETLQDKDGDNVQLAQDVAMFLNALRQVPSAAQ